jgi:hypothetical protein
VRFRIVLIGVVGVGLVVSLLLTVFANRVFIQGVVGCAVLLAGLLFEARRYGQRFAGARQWQLTDEKFIDPTTGHLMQVRFDPQTGDREYIDLGPSSTSP